jgi:large subunit ribosomal protein L13|tara:strand:- start:5141 stop:5572 length:432 start_codon:yes stop_codon:yes gene_type:complete
MKDTFVPSQNYVTKKWYVINAENQTLGRLATKISTILTGKKKISYTPFLETGDNVIIINAEKITISGNKSIQKLYRNHSGRPGGMRIETFSKLQQRRPEKIIEHAVKGMLPKNALGRKIYTNLKIYKGITHPHEAQTPELLNL